MKTIACFLLLIFTLLLSPCFLIGGSQMFITGLVHPGKYDYIRETGGTVHESQTWRRSVNHFAGLLFKEKDIMVNCMITALVFI